MLALLATLLATHPTAKWGINLMITKQLVSEQANWMQTWMQRLICSIIHISVYVGAS